ncbi:MAG TPA: universal stress protein [Gemmatimonadaceae bacterium]|nr:universal stress protein [Gemmatimonadaceae bacterium]
MPLDLRPAESADTSLASGYHPGATPSLLLAFDDAPASKAAARLAFDLAEKRMASVRALQVIDTRPVPIPPPLDVALAVADAAYGAAIQDERRMVTEVELAKAIGHAVDWPVAVRLGMPSETILHEAQQEGVTLIALGLHHHGVIERATRNDTVHDILRATTVPVLAATVDLHELPRRIVVGMDFSEASVYAARVARDLLADEGRLVLVYVTPSFAYGIEEGEQLIRKLGVSAAFEQVREAIGARGGMTVENVVLDGTLTRNIAATLRQFVEETGADLVALGARRHGRLERWVVGSVTSDFAREGKHSLLAVPALDGGRHASAR